MIRFPRSARLIRFGGAFAAALWLAGCAVNPATGERQMTALVSSEQEAAIGAEEHPKVTAQFGGRYDDPRLQTYVERVGRRLVAGTEQAGSAFTFTVLDSDMVNAFALPGGYVYITRGLLVLTNSEAELAAVMAHEIGHVTARHTAERMTRSTLANLLVTGLGIATGSAELAQVGGVASEMVLSGYSRDQEMQADELGVRYLGRTGYDPGAMAAFLATMQRDAQLRALIAERPGEEDKAWFFSTHPRTGERVEHAAALARTAPIPTAAHGRESRDGDSHLAVLDGLIYGESPDHGFVRGNRFVHPKLGFAFEVPAEFKLVNGQQRVLAAGSQGAGLVFDTGPRRGIPSMADYLERVWAPDVPLRQVETIDINGLPAATGVARGSGRNGPVDVRLVAIGFSPDRVYRFTFVTPPGRTAALADDLKRTTYSFRRLRPDEAAQYRPMRVATVTVRPGDTVEKLGARMPFETFREERFRVMNNLPPGTAVTPGQVVKLVVE
jgi:predicted Zn-dependent protease